MDENDEYRIVDAATTADLKTRVSKLMRDGWKCQGGPYQTLATANRAAEWHQAMVKEQGSKTLKG